MPSLNLLSVEEAWPHAAPADWTLQTQLGLPSPNPSQPESLHQAALGFLFGQVAGPPDDPSCSQQ